MGARALPALLVVLSLTAPPMASLVCAWVCAHETHGEMAGAGHDHHAGMTMSDVAVAGQDVCHHEFLTVQLFSPSAERHAPAPAVHVVAAVSDTPDVLGSPLDERFVAAWSPPDGWALSPPARSPVLRI